MASVSSLDDKRKGATSKDNQDSFFTKQFDNPDLEAKMDTREKLRAKKTEALKKYNALDVEVKEALEELGLEEGDTARIGKYKIEVKSVDSKSVSFETAPSKRVAITLFED